MLQNGLIPSKRYNNADRYFMLTNTGPKNQFCSTTLTTAATSAAVGSLNSYLRRLLLLAVLCGPVGNAFRESTQFDKDWCPSYCEGLNVESSDDLHPCSRRYLFIIAAGRSGSTTVMNMLNSLPGLTMSGENSGALNDLVQFWNHSVMEAMVNDGTRVAKHMHTMIQSNFDPNFRPPSMTTGPWRHGDIQSLRALPKLQKLYRLTTGLEPANNSSSGGGGALASAPATEYAVGSKVLGSRLGHVYDTVMLTSKLFPCSKFVWSVRRSYDEWFASVTKLKFGIDETEAKALIMEMKASHKSLSKDQSYWLELEAFTADETDATVAFNGLIRFLKYPAEECRFNKVIHSNKGKDGFGAVETLPEVLASRLECTAKLKAQVASNVHYFSKHAGGVGVDGAAATGMNRPLDWRCAPTCRNYYADHFNDGTRRDNPTLSKLFRWEELSGKRPGFERSPVEPYIHLYQILPQVDAVIHAPLIHYWRKYRRRHKTKIIPALDEATEKILTDPNYKALIWGAIEAGGHANPWFAPCEIDSKPHVLLPTLDPPIANLKGMTLVTIEPLYAIKGSQLCSKNAIDCSTTCWAYKGAITGDAPNVDCSNCQQALFSSSETMEMCFLVNRRPRSMAVPYPTNFVTSNDYDTMMHIDAVFKSNRPELMTYATSDHGTFSLFRATLRKQCERSNECTHYDCHAGIRCGDQPCSICSTPTVARRHLRAKFSLQPPGDSPTRQSIFDTLIQGCIPVFFSTCAQPDLLYETMYAPFLPTYARERFGAGAWAVVLDAKQVFADPLYVEKSLLEIVAAPKVLKAMQKTIKDLIPRILYPHQHPTTTTQCISSYKYAHYIYFDELVARGITTLDKLRASTDFWATAYFKERSIRETANVDAIPEKMIKQLIQASGCSKLNTTTETTPQSKLKGKQKYKSYRHKMQVLKAEAAAAEEWQPSK